jgi:hypothetical protein
VEISNEPAFSALGVTAERDGWAEFIVAVGDIHTAESFPDSLTRKRHSGRKPRQRRSGCRDREVGSGARRQTRSPLSGRTALQRPVLTASHALT